MQVNKLVSAENYKYEFGHVLDEFSILNKNPKKNVLIKIDELNNSINKNFITIKNPQRVGKKKYLDSNIDLTNLDNNVINITETLNLANECYGQMSYAKAALLYESVIKKKINENYLAKSSSESILQDLYLCHFNLWKKSSGNQKLKYLETASHSLFKLLTKVKNQTTSNLFHAFAKDLYEDALKEIGKNNTLAFKNLLVLINFDLNFIDKIVDMDINQLFDEILNNMTVCIYNDGDLNTTLVEEMFLFLVGNKLIDKSLKTKYLSWLEDECMFSDEEFCEEILSEQEIEVVNILSNELKWEKK
ncbi:MAG: hypothetical protein H0V82_11740 [Candidatus Protochlamydia sp.]|nr:hypothetical protein [Candidatus Protochlamydia sp.]